MILVRIGFVERTKKKNEETGGFREFASLQEVLRTDEG